VNPFHLIEILTSTVTSNITAEIVVTAIYL